MISKIQVLDAHYELLNTGTQLVLDSHRVTLNSGKVNLPKICIDNANTLKVFSIQQSIRRLLHPYGPI